MKITLNEFEDEIDDVILARGFFYYKKGHVTDFAEIALGEYEFIVLGTDQYLVKIKVQQEVVTKYSCDCPYDMGPVCKHVVASLFCLTREKEEDDDDENTPSIRSKTVTEQVDDILIKISHQELKDFVKEKSKQDKHFRNLFISNFAQLSENQSKAFYQKQIVSILNAAQDSDGFINKKEIRQIESSLAPIITISDKYLTIGNHEGVFNICTAIIEEISAIKEYAHDYDYVLDGMIDDAINKLEAMAQKELPKPFVKMLFDYYVAAFQEKTFDKFDGYFVPLEMACKVIQNEKEVERILPILDNVKGDYEKKVAQNMKIDIVRKYKGEAEAQKLIEQYLNNSDVREKEIKKAYNNKNFDRAIKLCNDGITHDTKEKNPGLVTSWQKWLLKIATIQKNKDEIVKYARLLFINNWNISLEETYQLLKENIPQDKWEGFLQQLLKDIAAEKDWRSATLPHFIFVKEKWWHSLFILVQQNPSFEKIKANEQYLKEEYNDELLAMYVDLLIPYVENNMGREAYRTACRYLRDMQNFIGGDDKAAELKAYFQEKYSKRKALLEELRKV